MTNTISSDDVKNIKCFVHICLFVFQQQYLIYEKLKIKGFTGPHDGDVTLTIKMFVPSSQVDRIIGKGGIKSTQTSVSPFSIILLTFDLGTNISIDSFTSPSCESIKVFSFLNHPNSF